MVECNDSAYLKKGPQGDYSKYEPEIVQAFKERGKDVYWSDIRQETLDFKAYREGWLGGKAHNGNNTDWRHLVPSSYSGFSVEYARILAYLNQRIVFFDELGKYQIRDALQGVCNVITAYAVTHQKQLMDELKRNQVEF